MSWRLIPIEDRDIPTLRERLKTGVPEYATTLTGLFDRIYEDWQAAAVEVADVQQLMHRKCRKGKHEWDICSVSASGHQSNRSRRCLRCLDRGFLITQRQPLSYRLAPAGDWGPIEVRVVDRAVLTSQRAA